MFNSSKSYDMESSRSDIYTTNKSNSSNSFRMKTSTAFILTLLALAIAVGVGLIVHFAGGDKNVVCQCDCGDNTKTDPAVGCPDTTKPLVTCAPCPVATETTLVTTTTQQTTSKIPTTTTLPPLEEAVLLPKALKPKHYNVRLRPNLYEGDPANFDLEGSVGIYMDCSVMTSNITLHIKNLHVTNGSINVIETSSFRKVGVKHYSIDTSLKEFLVIELMDLLNPGQEYYVEMDYTGQLQNIDLSGLYYSTYIAKDETRFVATTQLAPTSARKVFPSFDEPALKATFNITIERRKETNMISLSNMPQIGMVNSSTDEYVADIYQTTVVMPTYLVAVAVCDFVYKETTTKNNHRIRAYARQEYIDHTDYSLSVGTSVLDAFEDYFDSQYPLPKLDMIALPDFYYGAMENWGLITYKELVMFYHPHVSTTEQKIITTYAISHEIVHNWFGNMVTPQWWDDMWLNEGLATYFGYFGIDLVEKDWDMMNYIYVGYIQTSLQHDSFVYSSPLYKEAWTPFEISSQYNILTYFKDAAITRMMFFFLGENSFRSGFKDYIKSNEYGNVRHTDLWLALTKATDGMETSVDVARVMDTWIKQNNYPLINVTLTDSGVRLTQQRFLQDGSSSLQNTHLWEIPLTFTTNKKPNFLQDYQNVTWMNTKEMTINLNTTGLRWIILNMQEFGYYRVNYPARVWTAINEQLTNDHTVIHVLNRAGIISDAWALQKAGLLDMETALHTMDYLDKEREYIPWGVAVSDLSFLDRMLVLRPAYGNFQKFMIHKVNTTFMEHKLDIKMDQTPQKKLLQITAASRACKYGIQLCLDEAKFIFKKWKNDPDNYFILPDIKTTVMCTAIRYGTVEDWEFVFNRYANSSANDQSIFHNALSCSSELWILNRLLEYSIDSSKIRSQNIRFIILAVASNPIGKQLAWSFVRSKWTFLIKDIGMDSFVLNEIVAGLTNSLYTDYDLNQIEAWKDSSILNVLGFYQAIETVKINREWERKNYKIIEEWLNKHYSV